MILAVVDTNVVVSGLLAGDGESPNRRILDATLAGTLRFVLSDALLVEYREVLLRPAIARRHGLSELDIDAVLEALVLNAGFREPPEKPNDPRAADDPPSVPGDEHVVALVSAAPGALLITGDHELAQAVAAWRSVFAPADFAAAYV
jgi:putative PIN family toxin of toxin-antitoxin system